MFGFHRPKHYIKFGNCALLPVLFIPSSRWPLAMPLPYIYYVLLLGSSEKALLLMCILLNLNRAPHTRNIAASHTLGRSLRGKKYGKNYEKVGDLVIFGRIGSVLLLLPACCLSGQWVFGQIRFFCLSCWLVLGWGLEKGYCLVLGLLIVQQMIAKPLVQSRHTTLGASTDSVRQYSNVMAKKKNPTRQEYYQM